MSTRKNVLLAAAAGVAAAFVPRFAGAAAPSSDRPAAPRSALREQGLSALAAGRGILFGTAVDPGTLDSDPAYAALIKRECALLVPASVLRANHTRASAGGFEFRDADRLEAFARVNGMAFRGSALVWHESVPAWLSATLLRRGDVQDELVREVAEPAAHFRGRVNSWDVVDEAIFPADGLPNGLRRSFWRDKLGDGYIATAFAAARAADPSATLVLSESGIEADLPGDEEKRRALLGLLTSLRRDGVPVDALGIAGHLRANAPFDPERFERYLAGVRALGLKVLVTELDVSSRRAARDPATRDAAAAASVDGFLPVVLRAADVTSVVTWGLSERYALPTRSTLFDSQLQKKPAYATVVAAFDGAAVDLPLRSENTDDR
jgi:endo-1,4-beta-xylanase